MNVVERLGRRKQEARAGLELARQKLLAMPGWPQLSADPDAFAEAAALFGVELPPLAGEMADALALPLEDNLAVRLGAIAAGLARVGTDKLTLLPSPRLEALAPWVADRIARRTGGIVPVVGEPPGKKSAYGLDRLFVSTAFEDEEHDLTWLAESGHPVVQWKLSSKVALTGEFIRWEIAATAMGALLDLPPSAGVAALLTEPSLRAQGLALFTDPVRAQILRKAAGTLGAASAASPASWIAAHLALADQGDCIVLLPRFSLTPHLQNELRTLQGALRDTTKLACSSSAGGSSKGIFLELTEEGGEGSRNLPSALRIHSEDGDAQKMIEVLHRSVQLISKRPQA